MQSLRDRYGSLSRREQEVMALVVAGRLNKQVGFELGISEITVKAHRGRVMRKMAAGSRRSGQYGSETPSCACAGALRTDRRKQFIPPQMRRREPEGAASPRRA